MAQVYLDNETLDIRRKLAPKEFSKIVQNALKEHAGADIDLPSAEAKVLFLSDEIKQKQAMLGFWKSKVEELKKGESEKQEEERKTQEKEAKEEKQRLKEEQGKQLNTNLKALNDMFETTGKDNTASVKEYLALKKAGKIKDGFRAYFEGLGFRKKRASK